MKKILIAILLVSNNAIAGYVDGNKIYNGLLSDKPHESLMAKFYIFGVVDTRFESCIPDGVQGGQLFDVVKNYLINNPEKRQLSGSYLVELAIKEKFRCK